MRATRSRDDGVVVLNMTPMIDVVFQLIVFFLCTMRFRTLEKKLEVALPRRVGMANRPSDDDRPVVGVRLRQAADEGVPHVLLLGQEVRPEVGRGVVPLPRPPRDADPEVARAHEARHHAYWEANFAPKLRDLESDLVRHHDRDADLRYVVDAGPTVRHEYVVAVIDTFVKAGIENVEIRGTTAPRRGN